MPEAMKLARKAVEADDLLRSSTLENRNIYSTLAQIKIFHRVDSRLR